MRSDCRESVLTGRTSPDGPAVLHVRELDHLQQTAQHLLGQAASLAGGRVRPGRHEELGALDSAQQGLLVLSHQTWHRQLTTVRH